MMPTESRPVALAGAAKAGGISHDQYSGYRIIRSIPTTARHRPRLCRPRLAGVSMPVQGLRGTHPLTVRGHLDASTDPQAITAWWRRWPLALIGVPTGPANGFVVLDVDVKPGAATSTPIPRQDPEVEALSRSGRHDGGLSVRRITLRPDRQ
jgi:hypothetical protein